VAKSHTLPQNILILGATSAIAQATGRLLAERGVSFFLVARDAQKLSALAGDLRTRGAKAVYALAMDLDDTDAHAAMLSSAEQTLGNLDMALLARGRSSLSHELPLTRIAHCLAGKLFRGTRPRLPRGHLVCCRRSRS
jgi:NADP-dependent 3-hydroxy acid dehydrogenase YdfG